MTRRVCECSLTILNFNPILTLPLGDDEIVWDPRPAPTSPLTPHPTTLGDDEIVWDLTFHEWDPRPARVVKAEKEASKTGQ